MYISSKNPPFKWEACTPSYCYCVLTILLPLEMQMIFVFAVNKEAQAAGYQKISEGDKVRQDDKYRQLTTTTLIPTAYS